jgi:hypothetical protein
MGRGVLVIGAAMLGGITASVLTLYLIGLTGHSDILLGACSVSRHPVCTPLNPWVWAIPVAGVVGAIAAGVGASVGLRRRARFLDSSSPPLAPTYFR